jgi:Asp-tRNA(Asn)/Glu-tRNA(Gln) amidotransferase A subunit family amidase
MSSENLPIGFQLVGRFWAEAALLNLGNAYENEFPLDAKPKINVMENGKR